MSHAARSASLLWLVFLLTSCAGERTYRYRQIVMGVETSVAIVARDEPTARAAGSAAFARLADLEQVMSDYRPTSELMRLGASHDVAVPVSDDLLSVMTTAQEVRQRTDGAFDVTVGPLSSLWRACRVTGRMPDANALAAAKARCGGDAIRIDSDRRTITLTRADMGLDLGGVGKGFAAEQAVRTLRTKGCPRCLVAIAGDVAAGDPPPGKTGWDVEVATPATTDLRSPVRVSLVNASISTSGDTEQFLEIDGVRYSHLLDLRTGLGATTRMQATVLGPDGGVVDALSSALCLTDLRGAMQLVGRFPGYAALVSERLHDGTLRTEQSASWPTSP